MDDRDPFRGEGRGEGGARARRVLTGIAPRAWEHPADKAALQALRRLPVFDEILRSDAQEDPIVLRRGDPVSVFRSRDGEVVLRQRRGGQDSYVLVPPAEAESLIAAIRRELKPD